jgi:tetratricopeptide (TPR) repeat protein
LTAFHDDRIKQRFGDDRRFIRCDKFPASLTGFLSHLSRVTGAGVANPEDLTLLRPFLSSKEFLIVLDNAESVLDPQGVDAREIYAVVEELSQFKTICLCITSRIITVPRRCERLMIPTLSMDAACDIFYNIHDNGGRSDIVSDLLQRLDFHALSITLLATTASRNMWDYSRLAQEWNTCRTQMLRTGDNESLAATIELSLASPTFRELGPDARDLLGVIAFLPQGVDYGSINWIFPTVPDTRNIFEKFRILSLVYRQGVFITMLAPLRDYFRPKDPTLSPLLCTAKERYLMVLSVHVGPGLPGYEEARWIMLEDANVEHLLDVFTSVDANSDEIWNSCANFMRHLYWHKPRLVMLGPKLEGLPDNHPSKPLCLFQLSRLFHMVGNHTESKRLLIYTVRLWREWENEFQVAQTLGFLAEANQQLGLFNEGIPQAKESSEIMERLGDVLGQAQSLQRLAWLLFYDNQLDAAEEAASRSIHILPENGEEFLVCQGYRALGNIFRSKGETEKAIDRLEAALKVASSSNWQSQQFWIHFSLAELFRDEAKFDEAHDHAEHAKSYAADGTHNLGSAMKLQAHIWYRQGGLVEAEYKAVDAMCLFAKLGAARDVDGCREILQWIEDDMGGPVTPW